MAWFSESFPLDVIKIQTLIHYDASGTFFSSSHLMEYKELDDSIDSSEGNTFTCYYWSIPLS